MLTSVKRLLAVIFSVFFVFFALPAVADTSDIKETYIVKFNANGGNCPKCSTSQVKLTYGKLGPKIDVGKPTRTNRIFVGWYDGPDVTNATKYYDTNGVSVRAWDKRGDTTLYAVYTATPVFWVTTTQLGANTTVSFQITATGTFTVDWGDGNVETKVSYFQTVCRLPDEQPSPAYTGSGTPPCYATPQTFSHTYTTAGTYTIGIGSENAGNYRIHGRYTGTEEYMQSGIYQYLHKINRPAISFGYYSYSGNSIDHVCTWVKGISGSLGALFPSSSSGYPTGTPSFWDSFDQCTNLRSTIPTNLFSGVNGTPKPAMFKQTFRNTRLSGGIPSGMFSGIVGAPTSQLFFGTFLNNEYLSGTIPSGLFSGIQGTLTNEEFMFTFDGLKRMSCSIPENLFANVSGHLSARQFAYTFRNFCSHGTRTFVPKNLFRTSAFPSVSGGMQNIFINSGLYTSCPSGYKQYITGFESYWSGRVACEPDKYTVTLNDTGGSGGEGSLIEHYTKGWHRPNNQNTYITNFAIPSKTGSNFGVFYTFRGYYKTQIATVDSNSPGTTAPVFPNTGILPSPNVTMADVTYYAAWARSCSPGAHAQCTLEISPNGTVTYVTSCDTGYVLRPGTAGTYSPQCDAAAYTLTLDKNEGTGGTDGPIYVKYGTGYYANMSGGNVSNPITSVQIPTKEGYTFAGYYHFYGGADRSGGETGGEPRASTMIINADGNIVAENTYFTASRTISAQWTPKIYSITLDHNGATTNGSPSVVYYKYQTGIYRNAAATQRLIKLDTNPVKTGYVFGGYRAPYEPERGATEGADKSMQGRIIVDVTGNFVNYLWLKPKNYTITAEWLQGVYPIILDDNGANTNAVPNQFYLKYAVGFYSDAAATQSITQLTTLPVRAGYTFAGYRSPTNMLVINASGRITASNTFVSAPTTLTAQWTPNVYRISLDHDGADTLGAPGIIYLKYGVGFYRYQSGTTQITQLDSLPAKEGYTFGGYAIPGTTTNIISQTGVITTDTTFTTENTTIQAQWIPTCNRVSLAPNGGSSGSVSRLYRRTGQTQWFTNSSCTQLFGASPQSIIPTRASHTFRGFHTEQYDVVTSNNSSPLSAVINTSGIPTSLGQTAAGPTNVTYYAAWARDCVDSVANGSCVLNVEPEGVTTYDTTCDANYSLTSGANTYNPICTANTFRVTYRCGTGTGTPPATGTAQYGQLFASAQNTCTKPAHLFTGWLVSGTDDIQQPNALFVWFYETNKVFTAQWVPAPYLCKPGWYLQANTTACRLCPAGKYCIGGSFYFNATQDQGITGDVAAGYYSIAGADTPKGNGLVFAGHFSTGGATIRRPMGENDGCLSGYNCGKLSAPYYSGGGSIDDGPLCHEGNVCGACDINYRDNTMTGKTVITQCQAVCAVGKCVHEAYAACANAGITNWASDGPVSYGDTSCNVCPVGTFTSGTGFGANEPGDCGRSLRIGAYTLYLRSEKKTPFALHVKIDDTVYYGNVHQKTSGISGVINMSHNNQTYVICDETGNMCQGIDL